MQSNKKKTLFIPFINNEHFTYTRIKVGKHKSYSENVIVSKLVRVYCVHFFSLILERSEIEKPGTNCDRLK